MTIILFFLQKVTVTIGDPMDFEKDLSRLRQNKKSDVSSANTMYTKTLAKNTSVPYSLYNNRKETYRIVTVSDA